MDAAMLEYPAIEQACFAGFGNSRFRSQIARGQRRHKGRDYVTGIGCNQHHQPEARHIAALVSQVEGQQAKRHQRIAAEVGDLEHHAETGAGCA